MNDQANANDGAPAAINATSPVGAAPPPNPAGPGNANLPIGAIDLSPTPSPFGLTWPIALAAWAFADAAYWLASSILRVAPNLDTVIGAVTGSIPIRETAQTALSIRMQAGLIGSAPLIAATLLLFSVAMYMRRRWALRALAVWVVVYLLYEGGWTLSRVLVDHSMPWSHLTWQAVCHRLQDLLLPAGVMYFALRGQTRRQFRQWAQGAPSTAQPVWPVAIGWVSMYHAVIAMFGLLAHIGDEYVYLDWAPFWDPGFWNVPAIILALPSLARAALVVPAIALLKRRPNAGRLHIAGALMVLAALLAEPLIYCLDTGASLGRWASVHSFSNLISSIVYPVFLVFWFLRSAVERQVAQWPGPDAAAIIPPTNERGS
jgi:hypothetical protein